MQFYDQSNIWVYMSYFIERARATITVERNGNNFKIEKGDKIRVLQNCNNMLGFGDWWCKILLPNKRF